MFLNNKDKMKILNKSCISIRSFYSTFQHIVTILQRVYLSKMDPEVLYNTCLAIHVLNFILGLKNVQAKFSFLIFSFSR